MPDSRTGFSLGRSAISIVFNHLPSNRFRLFLRRLFYRWTALFALDKMVSSATLMQDGIFHVRFNDGTVFYGRQSKTPSNQAIVHRMQKLRGLERCESALGLLAYQYVARDYEKHYQPKKGDIIVDAGANIGTFSVRAAKIVGNEGKVIAIEPEASNLVLLRRNVEANELSNVVIIPKGVWSAKGTLKLNIATGPSGHSFYRDKCYGTDTATESQDVEVDSIDGILKELGIDGADFIKMDVEGAEVEGLRGAEEAFKNSDVALAIEIAHVVDGQSTCQNVLSTLEEAGFQAHREGELVYAKKADH